MGCCSSKRNQDGDYDPSCFTQMMGTSSTTDYKKVELKQKYTGKLPILVLCTDEGRMTMKNGKVFNTGNHPVEMLVPMLHFRDAGFTFDIATTTGGKVVLEMWAFPDKDENVNSFYNDVKDMMDSPKTISDIKSIDNYSAIFIPGGHGAMINIPKNAAVGALLHLAHAKGMPTVTLCHGPSALLATALDGKQFAYEGYKTMCFTDKTDAFTPKVGYLPGDMPWQCQSALEEKGMKVLNTGETGAVHQDRELITGDSPDAAENLGAFAAPIVAAWAIAQSEV